MSIQSTISLANERWPNLTFTKKNDNEACSPCPFCTQATEDGFLIFSDGGYWCRQCGQKGKIVNDEFVKRLTQAELRIIQQEAEISRIKKEQEKHSLQLQAIETMLSCTAHITYHETMPEHEREYWHREGITDKSIERWKLGYTQHIPMWQAREGYSIPVINNGKLRNIRYRAKDDRKPKYLPHMKNLPPTMFNADSLFKDDKSMTILFEGAKKSIVSFQFGFDGPAIFGTNGFKKEWTPYLARFDVVYICIDADALDKAAELAALYKKKGRIVELPKPGKVDDCFNGGMTRRDFCELLRKARMP